MSWRDSIQKEAPSSWRDSIQKEVSELESGVRGVAQGASFGFSDEITAALEAALTDKSYEQARDESRTNYQNAQKQNPYSYGAGELTGAVGTAFIPGMGLLNAGKGAGLATKAGLGAIQGGLSGLGLSNKDSVEGLAIDTATGAAIGGAMPVVIDKVVAPAVRGVGRAIKSGFNTVDDVLLPKAGKAIFGVDEKATQNYLANAADVNKAPTMGELADSILNKTDDSAAINEMKQKASNLSSKSWEALDSKKSIPKFDIVQGIEDLKDGLLVDGNVIGKSQERAFNDLSKLSEQIKLLPDDVSEPTLKRLVQTMDENINWNNPEMGPTNDALKSLRTFIDSRLKLQNPAYKATMQKTEDVTKAIQQVKSVFENRQNPESYDKFNKAVKNLVNRDELSSANQAVDKIQEHTGYNLRKDILDSWSKTQFEKGDVNGARKSVFGGVIGAAAGTALGNPFLGGAVGSSIGYTTDRYAGPIFKSILNGRINAVEGVNKIAPLIGKFSQPLMEAAKRGNQSLAATHFILQQTNPEYRKVMSKFDKGEQ
jgi:hypothetical protein